MRAKRALAIYLIGLSFGMIRPAVAAEPIIDVHVHAAMSPRSKAVDGCPGDQPILYLPVDPVTSPPDAPTEFCPRPIKSARSAEELRVRTIAELRKAGVVRAVLIGRPADHDAWTRDAPGMFIRAAAPNKATAAAYADLQRLTVAGQISLFAEAGTQYIGLAADDPALDGFWSMAETLDVPVGIHLGEGMPLVGPDIGDRYRSALTTPFQLEPVLKKHPRLRIYVMHAASPLTEEMLAMLVTYPSLYVDISANDWAMPRVQFYAQLKRLVDAGFSKRILFGSDQTIFPQAVGIAIDSIKQAPFMTATQKRDILYNNAARFLRLTKAQIAADHR